MRKYGLLDALLPKVRQRILAELLLNPGQAFYLSDLAQRLNLRPSSLQRELASLVEAGILVQRRDGNRVYFQADQACPVLSELRGLLIKTVGLADHVRQAVGPLGSSIRVAFIYGSIASGYEGSTSDVDLLVVGDISLMDLSKVLKPAEERLSRSINPTLYSETEFRQKLSEGNHFLAAILQEPKLFIIGTESELAEDWIARHPAR